MNDQRPLRFADTEFQGGHRDYTTHRLALANRRDLPVLQAKTSRLAPPLALTKTALPMAAPRFFVP